MGLNTRSIFLFDGLGAVFSATLTGLVLPFWASELGVSPGLLRGLGLLAALFAVYSLGCFALVRTLRRGHLVAIMAANLGYCALTLFLAFALAGLTVWGRTYFLLEIPVILGVVAVEAKVLRSWSTAGGS